MEELEPGDLYDITIAHPGGEEPLRYPQLEYHGLGHAWWGEAGRADRVWHVFRSPSPMGDELPTWLLVPPEDLLDAKPSSPGRSKLPDDREKRFAEE